MLYLSYQIISSHFIIIVGESVCVFMIFFSLYVRICTWINVTDWLYMYNTWIHHTHAHMHTQLHYTTVEHLCWSQLFVSGLECVWVCCDLATFNWYIYFDSNSMVHVACMSECTYLCVCTSKCEYMRIYTFWLLCLLLLSDSLFAHLFLFHSAYSVEIHMYIYHSITTLSIITTDVFIVSC